MTGTLRDLVCVAQRDFHGFGPRAGEDHARLRRSLVPGSISCLRPSSGFSARSRHDWGRARRADRSLLQAASRRQRRLLGAGDLRLRRASWPPAGVRLSSPALLPASIFLDIINVLLLDAT